MRFSILKKFLIAFLIISLAPLFVLSYYARQNLIYIGESVLKSSKKALIMTSASLLEARARGIARQVELFLKLCEDDLNALSLLPFKPSLYLAFSDGHKRMIWTREGTNKDIREVKMKIPLYLEITYADPSGIERIRILENEVFPWGRHVSIPFWGSFGREDYFNKAKNLPPGKVYVSHLMGRHIKKSEQLQGAKSVEEAVGGESYRGIIRFAAPVYRRGMFAGVVSLALDHRHLMEYTQHVLPVGNREVVFPSYNSGNYGFLFDDEGWIITHPKFWDIRGYDKDTGRLVDPLSNEYNETALKAGKIPFNLFHVPFIHKNYRLIAQNTLSGISGVTTTSSVGAVPRVMAYAPIRFNSGEYKKTGFFGGVTLGAKTDTFNKAVDKTASSIQKIMNNAVRDFVFIIIITGLLVGSIAIILARSFSRPILLLNEKIKEVSKGHFDVSVDIKSGDELESLGKNFQEMGHQLEHHRQKLVQSLDDLKISKKEAVKERDFIKSVFSNVVSGLIVIDKNGIITTVNRNTENILGLDSDKMTNKSIQEALSSFPGLLARIQNAFEVDDTSGIDLEITVSGQRKHIEITISHLKGAYPPADQSVLVVIRDITRRKKMEKYLSRSDRLVSLGTLAAGIAHEIRNPLTGISLMLDDLHDRMSYQPDDQILMRKAMEEIEKLESIVIGLLDFASNPTNRLVMAEIGTVIDNTVFLIQKQCKRQHILLVKEVDNDIPPILMDPEKMKQALLNIILNALNVMPDGGELHIMVMRQENPDLFSGKSSVEIRICDTGPGINPKDMDYIFDPFFTRSPKGSGLGLSITHTIIEEHNGKIMVDSKPGRGACFKIFFPLSEDKDAKNTGS